MKGWKIVAIGIGASASWMSAARGADIVLLPISASGAHVVAGNEITLTGGGQTVFLEIFISNWDPTLSGAPQLRSYEAGIDDTGFSSGASGQLAPARLACTTDVDCITAYGGFCSILGKACITSADCDFPGIETCGGSKCAFPIGIGGFCNPGFIFTGRSDYVFQTIPDLPAVDLSTDAFRYASATQGGTLVDDGSVKYAGTLVLDVPAGSSGTFTVGFKALPASLLQDANNQLITPLNLSPALITITCQTAADCDDNDLCTTDACTAGSCTNTDNFNSAISCCDPTTAALTTINDNNQCTDDVCNPADGTVSHDPFPTGTTCGSSNDTGCDNPDTCDGAGSCQSNLEAFGFPCGDPLNTDCTNPDTCDGAGACQPNHELPNSPCGDPTNTDCNNPDTCNSTGVCRANLVADNSACDDGLFCNVAEFCTAGVCGGGQARNCADAFPCTTDTCNEALLQCENTLDAGSCLISNTCRSEGTTNPAIECEECNTAISTVNWSPKSAGTSCGDSSNTECTNPDTCDGASVCNANHAAAATSCGSAGDTECDNPDTCDGNGTCDINNEATGLVCTDDGNDCTNDRCNSGNCTHPNKTQGTACGSTGNTDCDNPDTCNAGGVCQSNNESNGTGCIPDANDCTDDVCQGGFCTHDNSVVGTACGSIGDTDCTNPDSCDGAGVCLDNDELDGTVCIDDGNDCTRDVCQAASCSHPFEATGTACGDMSDTQCTNPDTCDGLGVCLNNHEPAATSCGDPADTICTNPDSCDGSGNCLDRHEANGTSCDDTLFCNGDDACNTGICVSAGSPCGGPCDEILDICLCDAPIANGVGSRYIQVTMQPPGSGPQAVVITATCANGTPTSVCLKAPTPFDVDKDGVADENIAVTTSIGNCAFQTPEQWGELYAYGDEIIPAQAYTIKGDCGSPGNPGFSDITSATTCIFGDTVGAFVAGAWTICEGTVTISDLIPIVDDFRGLPSAPVYQTDLIGVGAQGFTCVPDQDIGLVSDALTVLDAFTGIAFDVSTACVNQCP